MPPIKIHHTKTSDSAWDAGANVKRLKADQDEVYYRQEFAWQDPEKDPKTKQAYKFPHHEVDGDGNIGAANIKACQTIIGVLNGGMGGADIPDGDREGVYRHAVAHLKDAGIEDIPDLRSESATIPDYVERRSFRVSELRAAQAGDKPVIEGYAAVFNQQSDDLGGFIEVIEPGFFDDTLDQDVRSLWNHDVNHVLGRTKAGTLELKQDETGLFQRTYPPVIAPDAAQWAQDVMISIRRGDVSQMSFGFVTKSMARGDEMDGDEWKRIEGKTIRFLKAGGCKELWDVSPVTYPAYPQTSVSASTRSRFDQFRKSQEQPSAPGGAESGDEDGQAAERRRMLELMKMDLD